MSGLPVAKVVAYEPPYVEQSGSTHGRAHEARLTELVAAGDRAGAVKYFIGPMVGAPAPMIVLMQLMPWVWGKLKAVAHTLPYDAAVMGNFSVPASLLSAIRVPVQVLHGSKTDVRLPRAASTVAASIPGAQHRTLAAQTHNVSTAALAPEVRTFFG